MDRLDLRLVEYFVVVAEELHFGRAAARLHIAQPSLSQQIRRLESQLGVTLLERNSRNVHLTPAGRALLREGRRALSQAHRAVEAARAAAAERLIIGFYGSAGGTLLPRAVSEFTAVQPSVEIAVRELLLGSIDDLLTGTVDLAFTRLRPEQAELDVEVIAEEPRLVALPATHPLAGRAAVDFAELREERFIVNPAVPYDGAPPRWLAEQRRHGLPGRVAASATSVQEILALVAVGRGVCLVPQTVAQHHPRAEIAYLPVADAEPAVVSLARRPGHTTPAVEAFIETVRGAAGVAPSGHHAA